MTLGCRREEAVEFCESWWQGSVLVERRGAVRIDP